MVVYKSLNPRTFKGKAINHLLVFLRINSKAWVTAQIFSDWFMNCFISQVEFIYSFIMVTLYEVWLFKNGIPSDINGVNSLVANCGVIINYIDQCIK